MQDSADFGPYRLDGELGSGGMGIVYRALDRRVPRTVALKILHSSLAADPTYRERFRRESATLSAVEHPHIIPLYNSGEIDDRLYLDMRFITGDDLQAALDRRGAMPAQRAVTIIDSLADALDFVHEQGVLHRDIKPKNVMLAGARFFPYLLDFGIARSEAESALTQTGTVAGSLEYMAPERFRGAPADRRSDLYALVGVFVACLTGQAPYPHASGYLALANAHTDGPLPKPSDADAALAPFDEVVARGMAKDVADRYSSASDFAAAALAALERVSGAQVGPAEQWRVQHSGDTSGAHAAPTGAHAAPETATPAPLQDGTQIGQYPDLPALAQATPPPPPLGRPVDPRPPHPSNPSHPATQLPGGQSWPPATPAQPAPPVNVPGAYSGPPPTYRPAPAAYGAVSAPGYGGAGYPGPRAGSAIPPVAWVAPVGALLALIGMFLPWFKASLTTSAGDSSDAPDSLSAAGDGAIGLIGALLVIAAAVWVVVLLASSKPQPPNKPPAARMAGLIAVIAGSVDLLFIVIAWFLVPSQYEIQGTKYGDIEKSLKGTGSSLSQGPQAGYFLAIAAGIVVIVGGVVLLTSAAAKPGYAPRGPSGPGTPGAGYAQPPYPPANPQYPAPNQPYRRY